jgi:hypothetical protein
MSTVSPGRNRALPNEKYRPELEAVNVCMWGERGQTVQNETVHTASHCQSDFLATNAPQFDNTARMYLSNYTHAL